MVPKIVQCTTGGTWGCVRDRACLEGAIKGAKRLPPLGCLGPVGLCSLQKGPGKNAELGAASIHVGSSPVTPGHCGGVRVSFVGRSTFLRVWFWIKTLFLKQIVGLFLLALV